MKPSSFLMVVDSIIFSVLLFLHSEESRKTDSFLQPLCLSYAACVFLLHTACAKVNVSDPAFFLRFFFFFNNTSAMQ